MAAFDTTNARIAFVVPPSGCVRVVIQCTLHGAATYSQIMLGCLEGSTLRGRVTPIGSLNGTALATTMMTQNVDYVVSGLTPGASVNWDAAWGIETFVASSLIKYGGPNDTTANNAFGALVFQLWDPAPIYTPTSGTAPTTTVSARIDTIDDFVDTEVSAIKTKTDFLPSVTAGAAGGLFIAGTNAATSITTALTANIIGNVTGNLSGSVGSVTGAVGSVTGAVGSVTGLTASNLDTTVSSRMASYTQPTGFLAATFPTGTVANTTNITAGTIATVTNLTNAPTAGDFTATMKTSIGTAVAASAVASVTGNVGGSVASVVGLTASNLDATVSSRLASASYTAPLTAATTRTAVGLASANLDTQLAAIDADVLTRLATVGYTAPDNTGIGAIKTQTDKLVFTVANKLDVNILYINGVQVNGAGTAGNPWGP